MKITEVISLVANIVEIIVGTSAILIAWIQRDKISAAFSMLLSYTLRLSLTDLNHWIESLEESSSGGDDATKKFRIALARISGKIKANSALYKHFGDKLLKRINIMMDDLDDNKQVNETAKISLYSEIKELLRTLEVENYKSKSNKEKI